MGSADWMNGSRTSWLLNHRPVDFEKRKRVTIFNILVWHLNHGPVDFEKKKRVTIFNILVWSTFCIRVGWKGSSEMISHNLGSQLSVHIAIYWWLICCQYDTCKSAYGDWNWTEKYMQITPNWVDNTNVSSQTWCWWGLWIGSLELITHCQKKLSGGLVGLL